MVAKTPRSGEVICCLARILGESHDSGLRPGLDARADNGISSGASRTIRGKSRNPPFPRSGLKMGDFLSRVSGRKWRGAGKTATRRTREKKESLDNSYGESKSRLKHCRSSRFSKSMLKIDRLHRQSI